MADKDKSLTNRVSIKNSPKINLSLYEINKQMYAQRPKATKLVIDTALASIGAWFSVHYKDKYFILMNREKMDITIFHFNDSNFNKAKNEVRKLLESRGEIIDIQYDHPSDTYECWVKDEDEIFMYKLFNAQFMVIEV